MRLRSLVAAVSAAIIVLASACAKRAAAPLEERSAARPEPARAALAGPGEGGQATGGAPATSGASQPSSLETMAAARKLVNTGQVTVEVKSCRDAMQALSRLAESLGGYVADSRSQRDDEGRERGTVTLRVPAGRFDEVVSGASGLGVVRARNVSAQDVTKAYTDLETRLRVKRETADRLRDILKTRTADLADVLTAERELARVTEEIEQMEGERRFYDQQIALSTLTVELIEPGSIVKSSALDPLREAFRDALHVLASSLAAMVYTLAFLGPWLVVLWALWRVVRAWRARRARAAAKPAA